MYDKVTESLRRKRNEKETKTTFPAVIGRGKKQLSCRPITAVYIVFFSCSFRFRFVFVSFDKVTESLPRKRNENETKTKRKRYTLL